MKTWTRTRRRRFWIAAALASTLVAAPAAGARPDPGVGNGQIAVEVPAPGYVPFVTDFPRPVSAPGGDVAALRDPGGAGAGDRQIAVESRSDGFDWIDAGIGAGGMAGLSLLAAAAATLGQRRQRAIGC
jgi:hypothetical protein